MKYDTIKDATYAWVESFNAIPMSVIEKINEYDIMKEGVDSIVEITPPSVGDYVYIYNGKHQNKYGTICKSNYHGEGKYLIDIDGENHKRIIHMNNFEITDRDPFPMWGTMWSFSDSCDDEWANGEYLGPHLQEMADCGFRIYKSEDFGIIFGIDGCGYDFYGTEKCPSHWINLYKARGLQWHKKG